MTLLASPMLLESYKSLIDSYTERQKSRVGRIDTDNQCEVAAMREFASMTLFVAFLMLVDWIACNGRYITAISTVFNAQNEILALDAQKRLTKAGAFSPRGDP